MQRAYEPRTPRLAFGVAALAMTAVTIALLVVVPAKMDFARDAVALTAAGAVTAASAELVVGAVNAEAKSFDELPPTSQVCRNGQRLAHLDPSTPQPCQRHHEGRHRS